MQVDSIRVLLIALLMIAIPSGSVVALGAAPTELKRINISYGCFEDCEEYANQLKLVPIRQAKRDEIRIWKTMSFSDDLSATILSGNEFFEIIANGSKPIERPRTLNRRKISERKKEKLISSALAFESFDRKSVGCKVKDGFRVQVEVFVSGKYFSFNASNYTFCDTNETQQFKNFVAEFSDLKLRAF